MNFIPKCRMPYRLQFLNIRVILCPGNIGSANLDRLWRHSCACFGCLHRRVCKNFHLSMISTVEPTPTHWNANLFCSWLYIVSIKERGKVFLSTRHHPDVRGGQMPKCSKVSLGPVCYIGAMSHNSMSCKHDFIFSVMTEK